MIDPRLMRVALNPVQFQVLTLLNERPAVAVSEVIAAVDTDERTVADHLDELREAGLVEVIDEPGESRDPRYRALGRPLWGDEEWAQLGQGERKRLTRWIVDLIDSDARKAVDAGTFTARQSSHASRSIAMLDEQGWEELCRIHEGALEAVFAIEAASAERLAERGEAGFPAMSAFLCCELPPRDREGAD